MDAEKIKAEFAENGVVDNPFDVMTYFSFEIVRDIMFATHRFKNTDIRAESACTNKDRLNEYMDRILEELDKLSAMSDEAVKVCRETAYYGRNAVEFNNANINLYRLQRNPETLMTRCNPNRDDEFEMIRLGEDSEEYARLKELRDIADNSVEFCDVDDSFLCKLIDVINRPDECLANGWETRKSLDLKQAIVNKYHLTADEVNYISAYKFKN